MHPFTTKKPYHHAWIETDDGRVLDWQSMVCGHGGNLVTPGAGYAKEDFYAVYKPRKMTRYGLRDAAPRMAKSKHWGPWK